jgi:hypothetical protein
MSDVCVVDERVALWRVGRNEAVLEPAVGDIFVAHRKGEPEREYVVRHVYGTATTWLVLCRIEDVAADTKEEQWLER